MKKTLFILLILAFTFTSFYGCGSKRKPIGSREIVETSKGGKSPDKPKWVTEIKETEEKGGKMIMYFRGIKTGGINLEDAQKDARAGAVAQIIEMVETHGREDYNRVRVEYGIPEDDEDVATVIQDGLRLLADNVTSGVKETESYFEKYEEVTETGVRYVYDYYILVQYPEDEYKSAKLKTLRKQKEDAKAKGMQKGEEIIDRMIKDMEEEKK